MGPEVLLISVAVIALALVVIAIKLDHLNRTIDRLFW